MLSKTKVLLICLTRRGGLLHFNDCLAESLAEVCDTSLIVSESADHEGQIPGCRVYPLNTGHGVKGTIGRLFFPVTWRTLRNIVWKENPDVVHITSAQEWNPVLGWVIRKIFHKKLVYTIHDVVQHEGTPFYFRVTEGLFRAMPDAFVVLTENGKKLLIHDGIPAERILVVPHGVYDFFTRYEDGDITERKDILFFGRIEEYKGLNVLLSAFRKVYQKHPDWTLTIAGGGDITPYQELLDHPNIRLDNRFISDEEVAAYMRQSAIVALPYLSASQSGVIPTAFAFGKAVVATNVGGIPDMVRDNETGLLVRPNDATALSMAINRLIENPTLRRDLGQQGHRFAHEELSWGRIARKHADFYRRIN